ncbi:MAG: molybdenum cofactor biosynthesis protein MoaB [Planctomycetia bacterium]|nr:molybdenum cofactor biosynthesis protein MoaB [Planctomycetia bacterium]
MSDPVTEHRAAAPLQIRCAIVTVSDTRTEKTDRGGPLVAELLIAAGHFVADQTILPDEPEQLRQYIAALAANSQIDVVLLTGGTGIGPRDLTFETLQPLLTKPLPGYGELFRLLSYQEIGPAAMLSRAIGGLVDRTVVLSMPGSPKAVRLAMEKLILPDLGHLVQQARG